MSPVEFVRNLWSEGRVRAPSPLERDEPDEDARAALEEALRDVDASDRLEFPGEAPPLSMPAAVWAVEMFRRACGCLVHRDLGGDDVARLLSEPCPATKSPAVCRSVDLTFRFLPDLVRLARAASPEDPLVARLMAWCREWPLSSVGVKDVGEVDVSAIVSDPGLRSAYVDRIIERKDATRLADESVRAGVREALGAHPELADELARALA